MALWRCPHCGTPQPVAARCWVCRRSSTSCGTCRHFRASVAARIGYCGLDRGRQPLAGSEIRACWVGVALIERDEPEPDPIAAEPAAPATPAALSGGYMSGFVPVDTLINAVQEPSPAPSPSSQASALEPSRTPPIQAVVPSPEGLLWAELEG
jgi:hypothetical protein